MKKILIALLLTSTLAFGLVVAPHAVLPVQTEKEITIIYQDDSNFSDHEKEIIEHHIMGEENNNFEQYGLWCTLFGHDYTEEIVTVINHKVYDTAPRCVKEYYRVQVCSKCSDVQRTMTGAMRIVCCP